MRYVLTNLGQGLRRNSSMHLAVVLTLFVSLSLVGFGALLNRQTDRINTQLERLTISDNHATQRVNDLAGALKQQSAELERASAQAAEVVDRIRKQFKD